MSKAPIDIAILRGNIATTLVSGKKPARNAYASNANVSTRNKKTLSKWKITAKNVDFNWLYVAISKLIYDLRWNFLTSYLDDRNGSLGDDLSKYKNASKSANYWKVDVEIDVKMLSEE